MRSTVSTLLDSHHILHPREKNHEIGARNEPTIFRRTLGVVLVVLSIPFTLGIATGFYIYWAHRKVKYIEERDYSELQARTNKVFCEMIQDGASSSVRVQFEAALKAIQQGGKIQQLPEKYDARTIIALLDAALAYDNPSAMTSLMLKYEDSINNIHLANVKSVEMLRAILARVPEGENREYLLNKTDDNGDTALHLQKNLSIIKELVKEGAEFLPNNSELSPLHTCQDPEIAKYFIDQFKEKVKILNSSNGGVPAPIFTVPPAVVRVLIEEGANVTIKDEGDYTILFRFTEEPFSSDPQLLEWILSKVENADEKKGFIDLICNGYSILNVLIQSDQANVDIVKVLLNAGASYPEFEKKGNSPLRYVKVPEVAACLIDHYGKDIMETKNSKGDSPLIQARSNLEVFKIMIDKGVKVTEARDKDDSTILAYFSFKPLKNHPELIHTILEKIEDTDEKKAFVNHKDTNGFAALNYGLPPLQVVQALVEAGSEPPPVRALKICKDPELAQYLMEEFGDQFNEQLTDGALSPLLVEENGSIALSELCSSEEGFKALEVFVEKGLNVRTKDVKGLEPIHYLKEDDVKLAKLLIGNRRSDHDWGENKPPVMNNDLFVKWLKDREEGEEDTKEEG